MTWLNRAKRLPARMGDYLHPSKFDAAFGEWMAEDAIGLLEQLIDGGAAHGVRHCRFQMLAGGEGQAYKQGWHRDWGNSSARLGLPHTEHDARWLREAARASIGCNRKHVEWNAPLLPGELAMGRTLRIKSLSCTHLYIYIYSVQRH